MLKPFLSGGSRYRQLADIVTGTAYWTYQFDTETQCLKPLFKSLFNEKVIGPNVPKRKWWNLTLPVCRLQMWFMTTSMR